MHWNILVFIVIYFPSVERLVITPWLRKQVLYPALLKSYVHLAVHKCERALQVSLHEPLWNGDKPTDSSKLLQLCPHSYVNLTCSVSSWYQITSNAPWLNNCQRPLIPHGTKPGEKKAMLSLSSSVMGNNCVNSIIPNISCLILNKKPLKYI